jgi:pimeloyl-ACP methyl ester carboxylesterase
MPLLPEGAYGNGAGAATRLFVPGWGAPAGLYRRGLPDGWEALELPSFRASRGELGAYRRRLLDELRARPGPATVAGHSLGAALAVLAACDEPARVAALILLAPSGLPLAKPLPASALTFAGQVLRRRYPARELVRAAGRVARAPRAALRLARAGHDLDLTRELEAVGARALPCAVVACTEDRLATPAHCRRVASLAHATFRELSDPGGHIWPVTNPGLLAAVLG